MTTTIVLALQPWVTPSFVRSAVRPRTRQEGAFPDSTAWPISEVDAHSLADLCDQFRAEVFRKAGKQDPAIPRNPKL